MAVLKPFAFVLMPFDETFSDIYKLGIQAVCKELDVVAERVDEQTFSETILERIYRQIDAADFVIADMTGKNPNVFYEVGYAHARGKLCTLVTQRADDIPFDLRHHRHLVYGGSIQTLVDLLRQEIQWLKSEVSKKKTEAISVQLKSINGRLVTSSWAAAAHVEIVLDIHNRTEKRTPEIEAMYFYTGPGWTYEQSGEECGSTISDLEYYKLRHFIRSPVARLSPGAWAQVKITGRKHLASKFDGDELQESYRLAGRSLLEIATSEGSFREHIDLDVTVDEIPF